jgi:hypothetical protein
MIVDGGKLAVKPIVGCREMTSSPGAAEGAGLHATLGK